MTPPASQIIEDQAREASTAEPECTCALYNWDPNCPPYTDRHYSACPRYRPAKPVGADTLPELIEVAKATLRLFEAVAPNLPGNPELRDLIGRAQS